MSIKSRNYQLVELFKPTSLQGAGNKLYFNDQPQLRSLGGKIVQVTALAAYADTDVPVSPGGNTICSVAQFKNAFLVLNIMSIEKMLYIPLVQLHTTRGNADTDAQTQVFPFVLDRIALIDWPKSYVQFAIDPGATAYSYLFGVWYYNLPEDTRLVLPAEFQGIDLVG